MKSKISLFNKAIFKRNIRGNIPLWLGMLVLYLVVLPLYIYMALTADWLTADMSADALHAYRVNQMITQIWRMRMFVPLFAVAAVVVAVTLFSYLFTARNANMMHTFPVTRVSLFCTDYVSGLLFLILPQVVAILLSLLVGASMGVVEGQVLKHALLWLGTAAAETVFFYSMAVCVLMFAGNAIAAAVFYFILNFIYEGCYLMLSGILSVVGYGLDRIDGAGSLDVLTPITYMMSHINVNTDGFSEQWRYQFFGGRVLAGYLAAAVVLIALAIFAYQKKHLETAGDVITVGWLKPVFRWGVAICCSAFGTLIFCVEFQMESSIGKILMTAAILAFLAFFVAQMVLERSIRIFTKPRLIEGVVMAVCVCALYIGLDNDVFGIERRIPTEEDIEAVRMEGNVGLYAHTPDEVAWVRGIHKQIIDSKKEFESLRSDVDSDMEWRYVYFEYLLKDGSTVNRSYVVPIQRQEGSVNSQITAYTKQPDVILKYYFGIHYPDIEVYGATLGLRNDEVRRVTQKEAKKLYDAIVQDAKEGHFNDKADPYDETKAVDVVDPEDDVYFGTVTFDIRDEQGYITTLQYSSDELNEVQVDFEIDSSKTCILDTLKKLGYQI